MSPQSDPPLIIDQGPRWLVELYLSPPAWVNPTLKLLAVVVAGIVAYRLHQWGWRIDFQTQKQMQIIVATIGAIITSTVAFVNLGDLSYMVDVAGGFVVGYGGVLAAQRPRLSNTITSYLPNEQTRIEATWAGLAVLVMVGPSLLAVHGQGITLPTTRFYLAALSVGMLVYNQFDE